jgi:outer membrane protein assembly factor BamB
MLGSRWLWTAVGALGFAGGPVAAQNAPPLPDQQDLGRYGMKRSWHTQVDLLGREKVVNLLVHEGTVLVDQQDELSKLEAELKSGKKLDLNAPREFKRQREALLFAATDHGMLHCYDADTGEKRWTQAIALEGDVTNRPAITDKYVYATSGSKLMRLEKARGRVLITRDLPFVSNAGPAANDRFVFVPCGNSIYCYEVPDPKFEGQPGPGSGIGGPLFVRDEVNGGKRFNVHVPPGQTRRFEKMPSPWHYTADVAFNSVPILYKGNVIAVGSNGVLTSFRQEFGERTLVHRNGYAVIAPLGMMDHFVYLASSDFAVYCIDIRNGKELWRYPSGFPVRQQPVPFASEVLILSEGGGLVALDNKDGTPIWVNDSMRRLVAVSKDHVFAADRQNVVQVLLRKTGGVLGSLPLSDYTVSPVNQYNDRLYMCSPDGVLLCLHETASPAPYLHPQTSGIEDEERERKELAEKVGEKETEKKVRPKIVPKSKKKSDDDSDLDGDAPEKGDGGKKAPEKGKGADKGKAGKGKKTPDDDL